MPSNPRETLALALALLLALAVGYLGSLASRRGLGGWYQSLRKPAWTPPSWLFAPVWTILYLLMGTASWLVWKEGWDLPLVQLALQVYGVQLALNLLWSVVFFGLRQVGLAFVVVILYLLAVVLNAGLFYLVDDQAGLLLLPLLGWTSFAALLNGAIRDLNRNDTLPREPRRPPRRDGSSARLRRR